MICLGPFALTRNCAQARQLERTTDREARPGKLSVYEPDKADDGCGR